MVVDPPRFARLSAEDKTEIGTAVTARCIGCDRISESTSKPHTDHSYLADHELSHGAAVSL